MQDKRWLRAMSTVGLKKYVGDNPDDQLITKELARRNRRRKKKEQHADTGR